MACRYRCWQFCCFVEELDGGNVGKFSRDPFDEVVDVNTGSLPDSVLVGGDPVNNEVSVLEVVEFLL